MKVRRALGVEFVDELLQRLLLLGRPAQLQQHVLQQKVIGDWATIVLADCFLTKIASKRDALCFFDIPGYQPWARLRTRRADRHQKYQHADREGSESHFSRHGSPFQIPWPKKQCEAIQFNGASGRAPRLKSQAQDARWV